MKRSLTLSVFFLFTIFSAFAQNKEAGQEWVKMMFDPKANVYKADRAFEEYWQGEMGPGHKQFKRWENFMSPRVYPTGEPFDPMATWKVVKTRDRVVGRSNQGNWQYFGNDDVPTNLGGAGRVNCTVESYDDPDILYTGAASGGFWRSMDGGKTWVTTTDDLPVLGVSSIAIHPDDPQTLFMATGDGDGSDTYSAGVLKSTDRGDTWDTTGLTYLAEDQMLVNRLIIHPNDPDTILASSNDGIFKTEDGGDNWTQILSGEHFIDLEFKPGDPSVVYAASFGILGGGKFYKSTNTGDSFSPITSGTPTPSEVDRIEIGVTPADPDLVYFVAGNYNNRDFHGFYRSMNSGDDFQVMKFKSPNILGRATHGDDDIGQTWFDVSIAVSPTDPNEVFVGGINTWRTRDGGSTWEPVSHWRSKNGVPYVHSDIHGLRFGPSGTLYNSSDGGVFKTTDGGQSWQDLSDGLQIAQIYKLGLSKTEPDRVVTGWQDNGTNMFFKGKWFRVDNSDGMECHIHPINRNIVYASHPYGQIRRSVDGGKDFTQIVDSDGNGVNEKSEWVTPYLLNQNDPDELLVGKSYVYRSNDGGDTWNQLGILIGRSEKLKALALAPSNNDYIYVTSGEKIWLSTNGYDFSEITSGLPNASITSITVDEKNEEKAWVTLSGYKDGKKVYKTKDAGQNWTNISAGLPNLPANTLVQHGPDDVLFVGMDVGVYTRDKNQSSWQLFSNNLPNVVVNDLEIHYGAGKLRAATYGRGAWETDIEGVASSIVPHDASLPSLTLFPNPSAGTSTLELSERPGKEVRIEVRDAVGRTVKTLQGDPNRTRYTIDLSGLSNGTYIVNTFIGQRRLVNKMNVVRETGQ